MLMSKTNDSTLESDDRSIFDLRTHTAGPQGTLPLTEKMLLESPSGDMFGMSQNAGMGWDPSQLLRKQFLILGTQGGIRGEDGRPIALGYHTGHWEVGLLMRAAAEQLDRLERLPFAAFVSDPFDGCTHGTGGMVGRVTLRTDGVTVLP